MDRVDAVDAPGHKTGNFHMFVKSETLDNRHEPARYLPYNFYQEVER